MYETQIYAAIVVNIVYVYRRVSQLDIKNENGSEDIGYGCD